MAPESRDVDSTEGESNDLETRKSTESMESTDLETTKSTESMESTDLETTKSTESMESTDLETKKSMESTDLETTKSTESMEESTEECRSGYKRKAEMPADSGSSEDEDEMKEEDSCESDQAWGVDSFDDTEYEPDTEDDDDDFEWNRYLRHVYNSRGFKVDREIVPRRPFQGFRPFNFDAPFLPNIDAREYMDNMVKLALDKYNQQNGTNVTCDHIVRVVVKWIIGVKSYITFMARESPHGDLIEYQAKTQWKVWQNHAHPILCRPSPPMKPLPERYLFNPLEKPQERRY
ncbi:hypothetical protein EUTSA_v10008370mg [Eutrema salsugineum]|uniref:Cystatin domain-containing protein n=1 Tax=Eutrema salsugineum TaxID=72664 RepID=V4KYW8_EUTSA|nr:uncharacterized protein LOC18994495 [Eutrema salsugineum]ESQ36564.1 hypothetical protein EUTSA_v10008370mg [Eutrema salsugineum]